MCVCERENVSGIERERGIGQKGGLAKSSRYKVIKVMNYKGYDSQQATQVISIKYKIYRFMHCKTVIQHAK